MHSILRTGNSFSSAAHPKTDATMKVAAGESFEMSLRWSDEFRQFAGQVRAKHPPSPRLTQAEVAAATRRIDALKDLIETSTEPLTVEAEQHMLANAKDGMTKLAADHRTHEVEWTQRGEKMTHTTMIGGAYYHRAIFDRLLTTATAHARQGNKVALEALADMHRACLFSSTTFSAYPLHEITAIAMGHHFDPHGNFQAQRAAIRDAATLLTVLLDPREDKEIVRKPDNNRKYSDTTFRRLAIQLLLYRPTFPLLGVETIAQFVASNIGSEIHQHKNTKFVHSDSAVFDEYPLSKCLREVLTCTRPEVREIFRNALRRNLPTGDAE